MRPGGAGSRTRQRGRETIRIRVGHYHKNLEVRSAAHQATSPFYPLPPLGLAPFSW